MRWRQITEYDLEWLQHFEICEDGENIHIRDPKFPEQMLVKPFVECPGVSASRAVGPQPDSRSAGGSAGGSFDSRVLDAIEGRWDSTRQDTEFTSDLESDEWSAAFQYSIDWDTRQRRAICCGDESGEEFFPYRPKICELPTGHAGWHSNGTSIWASGHGERE